jgi:glycosyltransferase involved in cell wall biosynthesis
MTSSRSITGIIPVHNRREITLCCLRHLQKTGVLDWLHVCVVDDGSTDHTADAVKSEFPDVTVLHGDGNLWWTGAIVLGMRHALADAEAIFWLNDDCRPAHGALAQLRDIALAGPCVALGQVQSPRGVKHGGLHKRWHGLELSPCPADRTMAVATMNGNCVCLPKSVVARAGLPDAIRFPQAWGDTDYGLRCRQRGIEIKIVGYALCVDGDPVDPGANSWLRGRQSLMEIARSFKSPKNYYYPPAWWNFNVRHWGPWGAVLFLAPYLRFALIALARSILPAPTTVTANPGPAPLPDK